MHGFSEFEEEMEKFRQTRLHDIYGKFIEYLKSCPMPVKSRSLEFQFNITGSEVREIVKFARRQSIPVASSEKGYKYARNYGELASTLKHLQERRDSLSYTINKLELAWDSMIPDIKEEKIDIYDPDEINDFYTN